MVLKRLPPFTINMRLSRKTYRLLSVYTDQVKNTTFFPQLQPSIAYTTTISLRTFFRRLLQPLQVRFTLSPRLLGVRLCDVDVFEKICFCRTPSRNLAVLSNFFIHSWNRLRKTLFSMSKKYYFNFLQIKVDGALVRSQLVL